MAKKNKNVQAGDTVNEEVIQVAQEISETEALAKNLEKFAKVANEFSKREGYRIVLKAATFIVIDKHGMNVTIKLPNEELLKYNVNDIYYL